MEQYLAYKDSGIEWAREIPIGWERKRVGYLIQNLTGFAFKSELFSFDGGIKVVRGDNVTEGSLRWGDKTRYWSKISPELERFLLQPEDILIGMDGSKVGKNYCQVEKGDLPLLLVQRVARLRSSEDLSARFLYYNIGSNNFLYWVDINRTDPAIPHITSKNIKDYPLCLPPLPEQEAIASFLDRKTKLIDDLIEKKERLIELKKEERAAVINQAVTKGLNPEVPMKDSGIEWLGKVPECWEIKSLKRCMDFTGGYAFSSVDFIESGIQLIKIGNLYQNKLSLERQPTYLPVGHIQKYPEYLLRKGDILMSLTGTLGKRDYGFAISISNNNEYFLNQRVGKLIPKNGLDKQYALHLLHSDVYLEQLFQLPSGTKQGNFSEEQVLSIKMGIPPLEEQLKISSFLGKLTKQNALRIDKYQAQIQLLKEYKTSLIFEAVTGKIKVS